MGRKINKHNIHYKIDNIAPFSFDTTNIKKKQIEVYLNRFYSPDDKYYFKSQKKFRYLKNLKSKLVETKSEKIVQTAMINPFRESLHWHKNEFISLQYAFWTTSKIKYLDLIKNQNYYFSCSGSTDFLGIKDNKPIFKADGKVFINKGKQEFKYELFSLESGKLINYNLRPYSFDGSYIFLNDSLQVIKYEKFEENFGINFYQLDVLLNDKLFKLSDSISLNANNQFKLFNEGLFVKNEYGIFIFENGSFRKIISTDEMGIGIIDYKIKGNHLTFISNERTRLSNSKLNKNTISSIYIFDINTKEFIKPKIQIR